MFLYNILKPLLFKLDAEVSHNLTLKSLKILNCLGLLKLIANVSNINTNQSKQVLGIHFKNKIGLAAGLDKNGDYIDVLGNLGFGFIEIGTVTPKPQGGNPKPRLWRIQDKNSIINKMGFNNKGVDYLVNNVKKSQWVKHGGVIGINIGKNASTSIEDANSDYLICLEKVYNYASYITVNISSPNTSGLRNLQSGDAFSALLKCIKEKQNDLSKIHSKYVPIFIKIAPDLSEQDVKFIADSLIGYKIDGVIATNTTIDKSMLPEHQRFEGGLSGNLVKNQSNYILEILAREINGKIPIIGVGGIESSQDANHKIKLGASLVQVYSGLIYQGPSLVKDCIQQVN
ncbi:MAG: dihydroorotate dehydrogenase [Pseudomonadota bacterium]|jgi:dihydroorotate dehydrogenase